MANFQSVYIIVTLLWIAVPGVTGSCGVCYKKYVKRTGKCKRKISDGGRVIHMDFKTCCRRKNAVAWQFKCGGENTCIQCPKIVDGGWSRWASWSKCPVSCDWGNHSRSRECNNPVPQHGGYECKGERSQARVCYAGKRCPIHGAWGSWGNWQACSKSCDTGGLQFRSRRCDSPRADFGGRHCAGASEDSRSCNENVKCPVHGNWGSWGAWSACSPECTSVRKRKCDKPAPQHGGKVCIGLALQKSSCPASCTGTGSGSGEGSGISSGTGSGSTGSGDIDVVVENSTSISTLKPTKSTKKRPKLTGSGEGSGEDGSGSKNDDNEPGDATDGGSGTTTKSAKENVAKEGGSGGSGDAEIDIVVEKAPNRTTEKSNVSGKAKVQSAVGSGEDGSGSKSDDSESGDATPVDGTGKVTGSGTKNSIEGSGGSGDSDIDVVVEKAPQNTVENNNSKRKPGWGKKFEVVKN